jgi:hypothetical protein
MGTVATRSGGHVNQLRHMAQLTINRPPKGEALSQTQTRRLVDLVPVVPFVWWQRHHCVMKFDRNSQHAIERLFGALPPQIEGVFFGHANDSLTVGFATRTQLLTKRISRTHANSSAPARVNDK